MITIINGNPYTILHVQVVRISGVSTSGIEKFPTMYDIKIPNVILNCVITPKGPVKLGGVISVMNIGHTTEKAPAENPHINHPIIIGYKDFIKVMQIPITVSTSIIINPVRLPYVANLPPNKDPKAPPRGTAVDIRAL